MTNFLKNAGLGVALAATALTAAAPADAQRYGGYRGGYHHYGHGGNIAGAAILGGVLGLGVGAAIASSNRDRYYDRGYYNDGYYRGPPRGYYTEYRDYRPRCYTERRYDDYYGGTTLVRVCR